MRRYHPLGGALATAVPMHILELKKKGGPSKEDYADVGSFSAQLGAKGDVLLYGSCKKGEAAELFNKTARAIAVLSFCSGGITIFGMHFEAHQDAG